MIDSSKPVLEQWQTIDTELAAYGMGLDGLAQVLVLNKIDLPPAEPEELPDDERIVAVWRLSCATGEGVDEFRRSLFSLVPETELDDAPEAEVADFLVYRPQAKTRSWRLFRTDRGYSVVGTPPSPEELERALRAHGAREGVEVEIGEDSFELAP